MPSDSCSSDWGRPSRFDDVLMRPVFIIGASRSGTTLLQRLLLDLPDIAGGQETHFFSEFVDWLPSYRNLRDADRCTGFACYATEQELVQMIRNTWRDLLLRVLEANPSAKILLEKTPDHARHVQDIKQVFPGARFIHVIRDGRDVALSLNRAYRDGWGKHWAPWTQVSALCKWRRTVEAGLMASAFGPSSYLEVRFEALRADPVATVSQVAGFLGLSSLAAADTSKDFGTEDAPWFGMDNPEPEGFIGKGTVFGWRRSLSPWRKFMAWQLVGDLLGDLGYPRR